VYETEDTILAGSIVSIPTVDGGGGILPIDPITIGGGGSKGGSANPKSVPKDITNTTGKDQDEQLMNGSALVDVCWVLNEYEGFHPWVEDGVQHLYAGTTTFLNETDYKGFSITYGYLPFGGGSWPDLFQGYQAALIRNDGRLECVTVGVQKPHCRYPSSPFPLDAKPCVGATIGGIVSDDFAGYSIDSMWARFRTCMKDKFPQCHAT
jgi:hypothetical protein